VEEREMAAAAAQSRGSSLNDGTNEEARGAEVTELTRREPTRMGTELGWAGSGHDKEN
jgi:hypothetical protein